MKVSCEAKTKMCATTPLRFSTNAIKPKNRLNHSNKNYMYYNYCVFERTWHSHSIRASIPVDRLANQKHVVLEHDIIIHRTELSRGFRGSTKMARAEEEAEFVRGFRQKCPSRHQHVRLETGQKRGKRPSPKYSSIV